MSAQIPPQNQLDAIKDIFKRFGWKLADAFRQCTPVERDNLRHIRDRVAQQLAFSLSKQYVTGCAGQSQVGRNRNADHGANTATVQDVT